ncbi:MAG: tetratricopeptide repeat protein [Candidatus Limnocylindrales bacterium]
MDENPRSHVEEDRPLAIRIGKRIRAERKRAGLTQAALAQGRYTKAYVSALENGLVKPSMAALNFLAGRLGIPVTALLTDQGQVWLRVEADVKLASGDWAGAVDAYRAMLAGEPGDPGVRAELLRGLAEGLCRLDGGTEAIAPAAEAARLFRDLGRPADAALATYWQSAGHYHAENGELARSLLQDLLVLLRGGLAVEPDFRVRVLIALSMNEGRDENPTKALGFLEEARAAAVELDDKRQAAYLYGMAQSYRELGDLEAALTTIRQSLAIYRFAQADLEVAGLENELALVFLALGNLERAREHATEARRRFDSLADRHWLAHVADTEAQVELAAGDLARARALADESLLLARDSGNQKARVSALLTRARADRAAGALGEAAAGLEEAAREARPMSRRRQLVAVLTEWADVLAEMGDLRAAYERSREALELGSAARPVGVPGVVEGRSPVS